MRFSRDSRILIVQSLLSILAVACPLWPQVAQTQPSQQSSREAKELAKPDDTDKDGPDKDRQEFEREENWLHEFHQQRAYPRAYIPGGARLQALQQAKRMKPFASASVAAST
jgi:hypothetical protein